MTVEPETTYRVKLATVKGQLVTLFKAAPNAMRVFQTLSSVSSVEGALPSRQKELMALAIAIAVRCEGCLIHHAEASVKHGTSREEVAETIAVAVAMAGGPSAVYGSVALAAFDELHA